MESKAIYVPVAGMGCLYRLWELQAVEKLGGLHMDKGNNIFDILTSHATGERLDSMLLEDGAYLEARKEIEKLSMQVKRHGFSEEEMQMIDGLTCAYISQGICCMKAAYQQGFKDCAFLLDEIGLIK